jgi:hypothetical protein
VQSIAFFVIDIDIQQNAFLLDTIFSGAGSDITHVMHRQPKLLHAMQWRIQAHMCGATLLNW